MRLDLTVNLVSRELPETWRREISERTSWLQFFHTLTPVEADVHVLFGATDEMLLPSTRYLVYVVPEPPEIHTYDVRVLSLFDSVMAPRYRYLARLPQRRDPNGHLPWHIGVDFSDTLPRVVMSRRDLECLSVPDSEYVSVITSGKRMTRMQIQRLRFLEYLDAHLETLQVFGRDINPLRDKYQGLRQSRWHVALENSCHVGYWTEKLSDPLIARNHVFYAGSEAGINAQIRSAITPIDIWNPDVAYRDICIRIEGQLACDDTYHQAASQILSRSNLHSEIAALINEHLAVIKARHQRDVVMPRHRRLLTQRVTEFTHSMRSRMSSKLNFACALSTDSGSQE